MASVPSTAPTLQFFKSSQKRWLPATAVKWNMGTWDQTNSSRQNSKQSLIFLFCPSILLSIFSKVRTIRVVSCKSRSPKQWNNLVSAEDVVFWPAVFLSISPSLLASKRHTPPETVASRDPTFPTATERGREGSSVKKKRERKSEVRAEMQRLTFYYFARSIFLFSQELD